MKVKELIEKLRLMPVDDEVLVQCESYYDCSVLVPAEFVQIGEYWKNHERLNAVKITATEDEQ